MLVKWMILSKQLLQRPQLKSWWPLLIRSSQYPWHQCMAPFRPPVTQAGSVGHLDGLHVTPTPQPCVLTSLLPAGARWHCLSPAGLQPYSDGCLCTQPYNQAFSSQTANFHTVTFSKANWIASPTVYISQWLHIALTWKSCSLIWT